MSCRSMCGFFLTALLTAISLGCSDSSGPKLVSVSGKVMVDGAPLTKGGVRFVPYKEKGNLETAEPVASLASDGTYTLITGGKNGAALGWYRVTVNGEGNEIPDSSKVAFIKPVLAPRFNDVAKSGLMVEVVASPAAGAYDLKVSAK